MFIVLLLLLIIVVVFVAVFIIILVTMCVSGEQHESNLSTIESTICNVCYIDHKIFGFSKATNQSKHKLLQWQH